MGQSVLYVDPWSGVSGDMLVAALIDSDQEEGRLEALFHEAVDALDLGKDLVQIVRGVEKGLSCTRIRVRDDPAASLRRLADMEAVIRSAALSAWVTEGALEAIERLASVEASVHSCTPEEIHFHEVGGVDTLVDVVGALSLVEALAVSKVMVGTIPVGGGTVEISHGRMGVPAPATVRLLEGYQVVGGPEMRELTTPTGALLLRQLKAEQGPLPRMTVERVGYGAGWMHLELGPNVLRILTGTLGELAGPVSAESSDQGDVDQVVELQTNLDDVSPEIVGHTVQALWQAGALDVWTVPAYMKKGRPGIVLHALLGADKEAAVTAALFGQSGTLGVRRQEVSRRVAARGTVTVTVAGSPVRVKWGRWQGRLVSVSPEYEDASLIAASAGLPLREVMHLATQAALEVL